MPFVMISVFYALFLTFITALVDMYFATNGEFWHRNDNWLNGDPCINQWWSEAIAVEKYYTMCDVAESHVIRM
jgi:hypothetical protein